MFVACADEAVGALVAIYHGVVLADDDYQRCVTSILRSDAAATERDLPHVCILVLRVNSPLPPPVWRRRMAETNGSLRSRSYHFAVVCPNPIHRGVLTAILWLTTSRADHHYTACNTFGEAAAWVRTQTGTSYPSLDDLYQRAEDILAQTAAQSGMRAQ